MIGESVIRSRFECTGRRPVHFFGKTALAACGLMLAGLGAVPAYAESPRPAVSSAQPAVHGQSVADFYRGRNNYPLWLAPTAGDAAEQLVTLLSSASLDGLDPSRYNVPALREALAAARSGKRKQVEQADQLLSGAFV